MRKTLRRIIILFVFAGLFTITGLAQFSISGEFRPRAEFRNGYLKLGDSTMKGYTDILGRSRISFDYKSEKIASCFSLQHAFVFGENNFSSDSITKNTVNIYEGWFKYIFSKSLSLRIGRMVLSYDDQRVLGVSNWKEWGATHDAVNLEWEIAGYNYQGDFGFAVNNMAPVSAYLSSYNLRNYKYMCYLWEQRKFFNDKLKFSFMGIVEANQKTSTSYTKSAFETIYVTNGQDTVGTATIRKDTKITELYPNTLYARATVGTNVWYTWKDLSVFASGYFQAGHYKDGRKISAGFFGGTITYRILKPLKILIGFEHLSGNDFSDTTELKAKLHGFSTLWGTNHTFYGYMDMYQGQLGQEALQPGLNDLYGRVTYSLSQKASIEATYRWFSLPYAFLVKQPTTQSPLPFRKVAKNLGSEIDLMFLYKPMPGFELNAAYCLYFKTTTREILDNITAGNGRIGQYGYLMITYKPNFFNSEKKLER
jgi:hypothetical protein